MQGPLYISLGDFSKLLGGTPSDRTLRDWKKKDENFPESFRSNGQYDLTELVTYTICKYRGSSGDLREAEIIAKTELLVAQKRKLDRQEGIDSGLYLHKDEVAGAWTPYIQNCRAKLLAIPYSLGDELASITDPVMTARVLKTAIFEALQELGE